MKEGEGGCKKVELCLEDPSSNFHDSKLLRIHTGKQAEVLLNFLLAANVVQQLGDGLLQRTASQEKRE